jgi:hypothetical protein
MPLFQKNAYSLSRDQNNKKPHLEKINYGTKLFDFQGEIEGTLVLISRRKSLYFHLHFFSRFFG